MPIVDKNGVCIGLLAGRPGDPDWPKLQLKGADSLEKARTKCRVSEACSDHRRGQFTTLRTGFSHGGGQTQPRNLANNVTNQCIIDDLNSQDVFQRIAGFMSSVFERQFPELHEYYVEKLSALQSNDPSLEKPFSNSVFSSTTYNLGPWTECLPHVDFANLAFGLCGITALGSFEHKEGGHLILWELGLVIEFPPGSTILIPSAIINHSNVAIAEKERRYSFTGYSAGALFRWVDHDFKKYDMLQLFLALQTMFLAEIGLDISSRNLHSGDFGTPYFGIMA
ncbi:hypothetical protein CPB83DRAFT_872210 [Crepidotus variabilis]|uniref:Uncharacterized protein n=1 Tax=Crepidotus variabilis TaxID=179855 RepID=A0A9P6BCR6_9AGAR|nr:hypothetical protein CPB83DRAFT_872210 [Crepidotus variabilis]